jgi:hypothetical protein
MLPTYIMMRRCLIIEVGQWTRRRNLILLKWAILSLKGEQIKKMADGAQSDPTNLYLMDRALSVELR